VYVDGILLSYLYEQGPSVYFLKCPSCLGFCQMLLSDQESDTSYIGTSNSKTDLMRLGLIESHENSHLTRVILKKISIELKLMR
jgi:hypothetical protein